MMGGTMDSKCICTRLYTESGAENGHTWNSECPEHGPESDWYNSAPQIKIRHQQQQ